MENKCPEHKENATIQNEEGIIYGCGCLGLVPKPTYACFAKSGIVHAFKGEPGAMPADGQKATCCHARFNRNSDGHKASFMDKPKAPFACAGIKPDVEVCPMHPERPMLPATEHKYARDDPTWAKKNGYTHAHEQAPGVGPIWLCRGHPSPSEPIAGVR